MSENGSAIDASLEQFVRRTYLLVLGLGFTFVVRELLLGGAGPVETAARVLYFLAVLYFLTYDWIAYVALVDRYPYRVTEDPRLSRQGRFYTDLTHLALKACLILLALRAFDLATMLLAVLLFAGWHAAILVWHRFARAEFPNYDVDFDSHAAMIAVYLLFAPLLVAIARLVPPAVEPIALVAPVAITVVVYSTRRKRELLENLG